MSQDTPTLSAVEVGDIVHRQITKLQNGALADRPAEVAALAKLRRAVGKPAGSHLDVLQYTLDETLLRPGIGDEPSFAEHAAHACITLYALHQQAKTSPMHLRGEQRNFGRSVRRLTTPKLDSRDPVLRRFQVFGTSSSFEELTYHARGLVQQLRAKSIAVDYHRLATQLYDWQFPGRAERVRLAWGREFYLHRPDNADEAEQTTTEHDEQ